MNEGAAGGRIDHAWPTKSRAARAHFGGVRNGASADVSAVGIGGMPWAVAGAVGAAVPVGAAVVAAGAPMPAPSWPTMPAICVKMSGAVAAGAAAVAAGVVAVGAGVGCW